MTEVFQTPVAGQAYKNSQDVDEMTEYLRRYNRQVNESVQPVQFDPESVYRVVGSQESMLAITDAIPGTTLAIRTDDGGRGAWLLTASPASDVSNWMQVGLGVGDSAGTVAAGNDPRFSMLAAAITAKVGAPRVTTSNGDDLIEFGEVVLCNAATGPMSLTLPTPLANQSTMVFLKIDTTLNIASIESPDTSKINGMSSVELGTFLAGVRIICDGTNFWTIP